MEEKKEMNVYERVVRKAELQARLGLSDPTIWRLERDGKFPKRFKLAGNACGWLESDIIKWFHDRRDGVKL